MSRGYKTVTFGYVCRILGVVAVAMFSFCTIGAYTPKTRRNPAAKVGLPTQVVKEKESENIKFVQRTGQMDMDSHLRGNDEEGGNDRAEPGSN